MYIKLLIISVILIAFVFLALGVKLLFDPDAEFTSHSCSFDSSNPDEDGVCSGCLVNDPVQKDCRGKK